MAKSKKTYAEKLKDPRWQKKRLEILSANDFKCQFCGDTETTLHVHHFVYSGEPWEAEDGDLTTICEDCHWLEHHRQNFDRITNELIELVYMNNRFQSIFWSQKNSLRHIKMIKSMINYIRNNV